MSIRPDNIDTNATHPSGKKYVPYRKTRRIYYLLHRDVICERSREFYRKKKEANNKIDSEVEKRTE